MNAEVWALYISEELAEWERTGCPRAFAELRESFRRYYRALRPRADWSAVCR